jgi:undecaprenyl diphosphate synthase
VEAARRLGITTLTLYAFSADNWKRPKSEVDHLMRLFRSHLRAEASRCVKHGIRMSVIGRRDRLPAGLEETVKDVEEETAGGRKLHLRLAIDYSARDALVAAAGCHSGTPPSRDGFGAALAKAIHAPIGTKDVDLLIRTGGERRLSDFLLWESAYAELLFVDQAWPDFTAADLEEALREFSRRNRRFGGLPAGGETGNVGSIVEGRTEL